MASSTAPPTDQTPIVGIYAPDPNGPWYVQCRNPDGTNNDTSPPYPTYHTAANVLDKLGQLSAATANYDIGHRAVIRTHIHNLSLLPDRMAMRTPRDRTPTNRPTRPQPRAEPMTHPRPCRLTT